MQRAARQIAVLSGKGGTGKTTVLASFAALAERATLADCDVDAANLHLLLHPRLLERHEFKGAKVAVRNPKLCTCPGLCEQVCRFEAITKERIDPLACEGCGLCVMLCPTRALSLEPVVTGEFYLSETAYGPMAHAKLAAGGESSGKLVSEVRRMANGAAAGEGLPLVLIDGPPGIGCTAIATLADTDLAVMVTEPTLSGLHDLQRVVELARHFGVPSVVIINKADINGENTGRIRTFCQHEGIPVIAELPFDETVTMAIAAQVPLVNYDGSPVSDGITRAWERIDSLFEVRV